MNQLYQHMVKRKLYLEKLLEQIRLESSNLPEGRLRVCNDRGIARYYHVSCSGDTQGKYIPRKEAEKASCLAQKDYLQKLYRNIKDELMDIEKYLSKHSSQALENVYDELNAYRKNLVKPLVVSDQIYQKQWKSQVYESNPYYPEEKVYITKKDEMVRSKSEVMLADMYYELGIPYRYEAELKLMDGKIKYPDFTVLKMSTREVFYHEHFGLLDDEEYRRANLVKLDEYRRNGIFPGKNLIITYETAGCYLNIKEIKRMIKEIVG